MTSPLFFQCELLSQEYVDLFARYLLGRVDALGEAQSHRRRQPVTVAEVGAGSGRFAHFVRKRMQQLDPSSESKVKLVATDLRGSTGDAMSEYAFFLLLLVSFLVCDLHLTR